VFARKLNSPDVTGLSDVLESHRSWRVSNSWWSYWSISDCELGPISARVRWPDYETQRIVFSEMSGPHFIWPYMVRHTLKNGIAFERTGVQPVHENTRAYSISMSHEKPTGIVAPCKKHQVLWPLTEQLDMCRDMVMVSWYCYQSFVTAIKNSLQTSTAWCQRACASFQKLFRIVLSCKPMSWTSSDRERRQLCLAFDASERVAC